MKIVFMNLYSGLVNRGVETFVDELAERLSSTHQVYVFQGGENCTSKKYQIFHKQLPLPIRFSDDQLKTTCLKKRFFLNDRKRFEFIFTLKCLTDLYRIKPDIIIPLNSGWQILTCRFLSWFIKAKLISVGQSGPGWDDRWNLLMKPDCFIALTSRQHHWATQITFWKNQKIVTIPNGVDLNRFSSNVKAAKLNLVKPIILTAAASIKSKRIETTINAIGKLKEGSFLLLGIGYDDQNIDQLATKILGNKRFLHLNVSQQDIPTYYQSAQIFTLCSDSSEAFGIVYLEALASNLACVATDDSSRREIIGDAGLFVKNSNDSTEYAEKLAIALKKIWGDKPHTQAKKFSWEKISQKYSLLFQQVLAVGD